MATQKQVDAIQLYAKLMAEVKVRHASIGTVVRNEAGHPGALVREFCFLQLRMICELIALGCLVAHGDIQITQRLRKAHAADQILKQLEELHADYYPHPEKRLEAGPAPVRFTLVPLDAEFLTKSEVPILVGQCGDILHRGNIKKLLSKKLPVQTNFPDVAGWKKKIANLLNHHRIALFDGSTHILCTMDTGPTHNVEVVIAEAKTPDSAPLR
jgi:hypothetical protein